MSMFASKQEWMEYGGGLAWGPVIAYAEQATFMPNVKSKDLWADATMLGIDAFFGGKFRGWWGDAVHGMAIGSSFDLSRKLTKDYLTKKSGSSSTSASAAVNQPAQQDAIAPASHAAFDEMPEEIA